MTRISLPLRWDVAADAGSLVFLPRQGTGTDIGTTLEISRNGSLWGTVRRTAMGEVRHLELLAVSRQMLELSSPDAWRGDGEGPVVIDIASEVETDGSDGGLRLIFSDVMVAEDLSILDPAMNVTVVILQLTEDGRLVALRFPDPRSTVPRLLARVRKLTC